MGCKPQARRLAIRLRTVVPAAAGPHLLGLVANPLLLFFLLPLAVAHLLLQIVHHSLLLVTLLREGREGENESSNNKQGFHSVSFRVSAGSPQILTATDSGHLGTSVSVGVDVAHARELSKPSVGRLALSCQSAVRSRQVFAAERDVTEESIPPLGSCPNERGERLIWLEDAMADLLFPRSATVLCSAWRG